MNSKKQKKTERKKNTNKSFPPHASLVILCNILMEKGQVQSTLGRMSETLWKLRLHSKINTYLGNDEFFLK